MCIRFGMISADTDVEELLSLVVRTGTELDDQVGGRIVPFFRFS